MSASVRARDRDTNRAVTVVVPVRDDAAHVGRCLASLIELDGGPPAIVVVDDGSTDGSGDVARRAAPEARILRLDPSGAAAARNAGILVAATPFIAFCDADDRFPADRLTADLAQFAAEPATEAVLGHALLCVDESAALGNERADPGDAVLLHSFGGMTARRSVFDRTGLLDESLAHYEDYDWFLRVREAGVRLVVRPGVAFERHVRPGSVSQMSAREDAPPMLLATLKHSLDRRRAGGGVAASLPQLSELLVPEDDAGDNRAGDAEVDR